MKIELVKGDIFFISCDAIVNPTDVKLSGSGGLDRELRRRAGEEVGPAVRRSPKRDEARRDGGYLRRLSAGALDPAYGGAGLRQGNRGEL